MPMMPPQTPAQAIERTVREEWGRILAALVKSLGDFQLAEDCLQDAVARALEVWADKGLPDVPAAWLITTARHRAIDVIRKDTRFAAHKAELSHLLDEAQHDDITHEVIPDKRLEMIFTCCHPALDQKTQVALTLRTLGGLSTDDIAAAFLDKPATMAQRLVRAKQKIAGARIPYQIPQQADLAQRITAVLAVIYLIFNRGYSTLNARSQPLTTEAIRLARIMCQLLPDEPEIMGLLALMLLHNARRHSRRNREGDLIPLDEQNRKRWDRAQIDEGNALLGKALPQGAVGPYQLQAAISGVHANGATWDETDWAQIAALYTLLFKIQPTPVIQINHAVAVSYAQSVSAGLTLLSPLEDAREFARYQPYHAACAALFARNGEGERAKQSYAKAIALTDDPAERRFLRRKCDQIS
ncbi:RNA polymerase sigma factor [Yoonia sp. GPGPB17]|uniref:RNA polymerase sigma factor n=1 Tax=Yoonia sp. GPGPB17 TaxID=3026147 RepID=UPI0030C61D72